MGAPLHPQFAAATGIAAVHSSSCHRAAAPGAAGPTATANDQALWHDFHDKFLSYGGPPIPLLRKLMLGEEGSVL